MILVAAPTMSNWARACCSPASASARTPWRQYERHAVATAFEDHSLLQSSARTQLSVNNYGAIPALLLYSPLLECLELFCASPRIIGTLTLLFDLSMAFARSSASSTKEQGFGVLSAICMSQLNRLSLELGTPRPAVWQYFVPSSLFVLEVAGLVSSAPSDKRCPFTPLKFPTLWISSMCGDHLSPDRTRPYMMDHMGLLSATTHYCHQKQAPNIPYRSRIEKRPIPRDIGGSLSNRES